MSIQQRFYARDKCQVSMFEMATESEVPDDVLSMLVEYIDGGGFRKGCEKAHLDENVATAGHTLTADDLAQIRAFTEENAEELSVLRRW